MSSDQSGRIPGHPPRSKKLRSILLVEICTSFVYRKEHDRYSKEQGSGYAHLHEELDKTNSLFLARNLFLCPLN